MSSNKKENGLNLTINNKLIILEGEKHGEG